MSDTTYLSSNIITEAGVVKVIKTNIVNSSKIKSEIITGGRGVDGVGIPSGGNEGQILTKVGEGDFETEWQDPVIPTPPVASVNGRTGAVTGLAEQTALTAGLALKADASTTTAALATKVDKVTGKQLSTEDFTSAAKTKLDGIAAGAQVNPDPATLPVSTATQAALNNKANFPSSNSNVPVRSGSGVQSSIGYSAQVSSDTIVTRTNTGTVKGATATAGDDLATKAQVDAADALKADKTTTPFVVYTTGTAGAPVFRPYASTAVASSFVTRDPAGQAEFSTPTTPTHAATKAYVDALTPTFGTGQPNGNQVAPVGSRYIDNAATGGYIEWIKEVGSGNTGWVAVPRSVGTSKTTVSPTQPTGMAIGDVWIVA